MNLSAPVIGDEPPGVVTRMSTVLPVTPAGAVARIEVSLRTVKVVAIVPPNLTATAPVKLLPVMVTTVPPLCEPADGLRAVTIGAGYGWTRWVCRPASSAAACWKTGVRSDPAGSQKKWSPSRFSLPLLLQFDPLMIGGDAMPPSRLIAEPPPSGQFSFPTSKPIVKISMSLGAALAASAAVRVAAQV